MKLLIFLWLKLTGTALSSKWSCMLEEHNISCLFLNNKVLNELR